jgi:hypothetical protein
MVCVEISTSCVYGRMVENDQRTVKRLYVVRNSVGYVYLFTFLRFSSLARCT